MHNAWPRSCCRPVCAGLAADSVTAVNNSAGRRYDMPEYYRKLLTGPSNLAELCQNMPSWIESGQDSLHVAVKDPIEHCTDHSLMASWSWGRIRKARRLYCCIWASLHVQRLVTHTGR
jgi:hypothetical protein